MKLNNNKFLLALSCVILIILFFGFIIVVKCYFCNQKNKYLIQEVTRPTDMEGIRYFYPPEKRKKTMTLDTIVSWEWGWAWAPTPDGFEISPQEVDFIYSSVLRNAWHFGVPDSSVIYYDTNSYYVSNYSMIYKDYESLIQNTTQINGRDGRVFNPISNIWENVGYIHMTYPEVVGQIKTNETRSGVISTLGRAFESHTPAHPMLFFTPTGLREAPDTTESLEYWCRNGNFIILLTDGYVTSVITNVPFGRM